MCTKFDWNWAAGSWEGFFLYEYRPWSVILHQWNAEQLARNDWNGKQNAERFARNDSKRERLKRFGLDFNICISETLAIYYFIIYKYLEISLFNDIYYLSLI
jgi:hypothetical protein